MSKEIVSEKKENKNVVAGIDLDKLVRKAQDSYEKKEMGLARQITTGKSIVKPSEDKDFIMWTKGNHWQSLTGLKGLPWGYTCQISGKSDSGKSTIACCFMQEAQSQGALVILLDSERKFSAKRFDSKMGGNSEQLVCINTTSIIEGSEAVAKVVNSAKELNPNVKILIVWDSVGSSLSSQDSDEDSKFSHQPGQEAKQISYAIKKFNKLINRYMNKDTGEQTIAVLTINQTYASIGYGVSTQIEKGGGQLYYLSSLILQLSRKQDLTRVVKGEKYKYGIVTRAKVKKNHLSENDECIAEMDLVISADGVHLAKDIKNFEDIKGWDDNEDDGEE